MIDRIVLDSLSLGDLGGGVSRYLDFNTSVWKLSAHTGMLYQKWTQNYKQTLSNLETFLAADIYKTQSDFLLHTYLSACHLPGDQ